MIGKIFTITVILLVLILAVTFLPDITDAAHDTATDDRTDTANVTTDVAETTAPMTLTRELYSDNIGYISSLTSGNGGDTPIADSYDSTSGNVTISGLAADDWRIITMAYDADSSEDYTGLAAGLKMLPTLMMLLIFGLVAATIYRVVT